MKIDRLRYTLVDKSPFNQFILSRDGTQKWHKIMDFILTSVYILFGVNVILNYIRTYFTKRLRHEIQKYIFKLPSFK